MKRCQLCQTTENTFLNLFPPSLPTCWPTYFGQFESYFIQVNLKIIYTGQLEDNSIQVNLKMLEWIKVGENLALEHNRGRTGWQIQRFHIYSSWFLLRKNWILGAFVFLILYIWALLRRMYVVTPNWLQFEVRKKVELLFYSGWYFLCTKLW